MTKASGRAFPRYDRTNAAPAMRDAARQIVSNDGVPNLFRRLAEELPITRSAPLHHFGAISGLLGAIAEQVFEELAADLREVRTAAPAGEEALIGMARHLAAFALANEKLYQAIHSPELWQMLSTPRAAADGDATARTKSKGRDRALDWVLRAERARDEAFGEFAEAATHRNSARSSDEADETWMTARMVTALVDGYLFQRLNENVLDGESAEDATDLVGDLVALALRS